LSETDILSSFFADGVRGGFDVELAFVRWNMYSEAVSSNPADEYVRVFGNKSTSRSSSEAAIRAAAVKRSLLFQSVLSSR